MQQSLSSASVACAELPSPAAKTTLQWVVANHCPLGGEPLTLESGSTIRGTLNLRRTAGNTANVKDAATTKPFSRRICLTWPVNGVLARPPWSWWCTERVEPPVGIKPAPRVRARLRRAILRWAVQFGVVSLCSGSSRLGPSGLSARVWQQRSSESLWTYARRLGTADGIRTPRDHSCGR